MYSGVEKPILKWTVRQDKMAVHHKNTHSYYTQVQLLSWSTFSMTILFSFASMLITLGSV